MDDGGFLFIHEEGAGSHKPVTRSLIKMHVMDKVVLQRQALRSKSTNNRGRTAERRQQRQATSFSAAADSLPAHSTHSQQTFVVDRYVGTESLQSLAGIGEMLQLSGLDVKRDEVTKFLLHHFVNHRSRSLCTVTIETGWLSYALQDSALFNTTLYHWAILNYDCLPGRFQHPEHLLRLKGSAIQIIALQLRSLGGELSSPANTVSDGLIASVACLANVNLILGDVEEAKIHFQGLKSIVEARNGILHLGYQGLVTRMVKWTDSCRAQLLNTELSFDDHDSLPNYISPHFALADPYETQIQPFKLPIIDGFRNISKEIIATLRNSMSLDQRVAIGQRLLASDRALLDHIHNSNYRGVPALLARSALIYSHVVLRGTDRSFHIVKSLVNQLQQSIVSTCASRAQVFADSPMVLVWVLLVGMLASGTELPEGVWFKSHLELACGSGAGLAWEAVQSMVDAPNSVSPRPFYWILEEIPLHLASINTQILQDEMEG